MTNVATSGEGKASSCHKNIRKLIKERGTGIIAVADQGKQTVCQKVLSSMKEIGK